MRQSVLIAVVASLACSAPARADTAADIAAIEQAWGEAFLTNDRAFLERLLAPEFKLMRADGGRPQFTPRAQWMANYQSYIFHDFQVRTIDVVDAGETAVATIIGRWKVGLQGRPGTREEAFIVSDTFVRRGGAWHVVYRHSTPFPLPPVTPASAATSAERGR